jgi:hypothetical protein
MNNQSVPPFLLIVPMDLIFGFWIGILIVKKNKTLEDYFFILLLIFFILYFPIINVGVFLALLSGIFWYLAKQSP